MSAIDTALSAIDRVAEEGDLAPERRSDVLELEALADPLLLPDRRGCTASRSTSSPARCSTWSTQPTRRSCG